MGLAAFNRRRRELAALEAQKRPQMAQEPPQDPAEGKPLSRMNKAELEALAADLGLDTTGTVSELRERIKAAQEAQGDGGEEGED